MSQLRTLEADLEAAEDSSVRSPAVPSRRARIRATVRNHPWVSLFVLAFVIRALVAIGAELFIGIPVFGDDGYYHYLAESIAADVTSAFDFDSNIVFRATRGFLLPVAFLYRITAPEPLIGMFFVALFGAGTAAAAAWIGGRISVRAGVITGVIVALMPSQVLWSSLLLKDGMVWCITAVIGVLFHRALKETRRNHLIALAAGGAALLYLLANVREHTLVIVVWALLLASLVVSWHDRRRGIAAVGALAFLVPLLAGAGPLGLGLVANPGYDASAMRYYHARDAENTAFAPVPTTGYSTSIVTLKPRRVTTTTIEESGSPGRGGSGGSPRPRGGGRESTTTTSLKLPHRPDREDFLPPTSIVMVDEVTEKQIIEDSSSIGADVRAMPRGISVMLLEPFPWSPVGNWRVRVAQVEGIVWFPVLVLALLAAGVAWKRRDVLAYPILAAGGTLCVYAATEGNFGTAYRHRGELVWVIALLAGVTVDGFLRRRQARATTLELG